MATSNIKLFDENKVNMMPDEAYQVETQRTNGVQSGIASSQLQNKTLYQVSLVSYAIAQIMNQNGLDANDSDAVTTFVNNLSSAVLQKVQDIANTAEAQAGVINNKWMSPSLVKAAIDVLAAKSQNILSDETKTLYGLGADAVPDEVFQEIFGLTRNSLTNRVFVRFTTSVNWVAPENILNNKVRVICVGGGGGGGGGFRTSSSKYGGSGGGGSGYIEIQDVTVTPGTSYAITIGAGGAGGAKGAAGKAGGATSFGSLVTANGGSGGAVYGAGGGGNAGGGAGRNSYTTSGAKGGDGSTYGGGGGGAFHGTKGGAGGAGGKYGGGGGGGAHNNTSTSGGAGGAGGEFGGNGGKGVGVNDATNGLGTNGTPFSASVTAFFPFVITNTDGLAGGAIGGNAGYGGASGGGGFGGRGGNASMGSGGGGGYGGNGGDGDRNGSGGGGGGLGGNGGLGYGGGGGGGGFFGNGGDGWSNYSSGYFADGENGSGAGGGGGYRNMDDDDGWTGGYGGSGCCCLVWQEG